MHFSSSQLLALGVTASFAAGLNVYAMLLTLGLLARSGVLQLPASLHPVESWWCIAIAGAMFALEFVADKFPGFDLIWNALHTFIRIPIGALVAYAASSHLSPQMQALSAVLGGVLAATAHGTKTAARAVVTPSPEPVSNVALSATEDVAAVGLTWFATHHPYIAAGIAIALAILGVLLIRWSWRALKRLFARTRSAFAHAA